MLANSFRLFCTFDTAGDALLTTYREHAWLTARGRQRADSTHVLAQGRAGHRLECVGATLGHALKH